MLAWIGLVSACVTGPTLVEGDSGSDAATDGRDLREAYPDPPLGGLQLMAPDLEVAPWGEVFWCYFGTYEGPTVGVNYMAPLQVDEFNHHNLLKAVVDGKYDSDLLMECPPQEGMPEFFPLFESVGGGLKPDEDYGAGSESTTEGQSSFGATAPDYPVPMGDHSNWINLPAGLAIRLDSGQPWVLDTHYINPTGDALLVNSGINLGLVPEAEVEAWASTLHHDAGEMISLPPGETTSVSFDCEWEQAASLLSLTGHMHEHGTSYKIEWIREDSVEVLYELDPWQEAYRDQPVMVNWAADEIAVQAGDKFRTTCTWFNSTDHEILNPEEMCSTGGVAFPLDEPFGCVAGETW